MIYCKAEKCKSFFRKFHDCTVPRTERLENVTLACAVRRGCVRQAPEQQLLHRERMEHLKAAISRLPAADRKLFYRRYYYLQPVAQIAAELGLSQRAAEGRLYRLRQKLRQELGGEGQ